MRQIMIVLALFGLLLTSPAALGSDCQRYWDSRAAQDQYGNSWCWLSGRICYQCYDLNSGDNCSADWGECDPYPPMPEVRTAIHLELMEIRDGTTKNYCQASASAVDLPSAQELL